MYRGISRSRGSNPTFELTIASGPRALLDGSSTRSLGPNLKEDYGELLEGFVKEKDKAPPQPRE